MRATTRASIAVRASAAILLAAAIAAAGCGGAGGGAGPGGAGQGLVLVSFLQSSLDNVALNTRLEFVFSEDLDPDSANSSAIQIREGPSFGLTVPGTLKVDGSRVIFEPRLATLCDLSDSGFKADTTYRITFIGSPEEFSLRNTRGQPLRETTTREFSTRIDTDPQLFTDQIPAVAPSVTEATPTDGSEAVAVEDGNRVVLTISENLRPCSVSDATVFFEIYQFGDPGTTVAADGGAGNPSGFATDVGQATSDQTPGDPFTWTTAALQASVVDLPAPQKVLAEIDLVQSFDGTQIVVTPSFGYNPNPALNRSRFPEDALIVLRLSFGVEDYGGNPLLPFTMAFTTENLPLQNSTYEVETLGETPWDEGLSTARIDESSPGVVQGFLLFSGDGDNGTNELSPTLPQSNPPLCTADYQSNDSTLDDFDPSGDVLLDTGATANGCPNDADGSFAVVWEFNTFRIRNGVTVRVIGVNPAIILSQGDVNVEAGGRLLLRGDNQGGAPRGAGEGNRNATTTSGAAGGTGVAGGGDGGACLGGNGGGSARYSGHGVTGYYHASATGPLASDVGDVGGTGAGHGNSSARWNTQANPNNRNTPSGGGGGHATPGSDGVANGTGSTPTSIDLPLDGAGGGIYGETNGRMVKPEAGSGGGAGAELRPFTSNVGRGPGGGGGAGGGFIDITSGGNIVVLGTIDAAGSQGGNHPGGNFNPNYSWNPGTGGGGGGSGGGIRLLTPRDIVVGATTTITAAGGVGGAGGASQAGGPALNPGGNGGMGRVVLETGSSIITGLSTAGVTPNEGSPGFYRGTFDATRFQGGGLAPVGVSQPFSVGPYNPTYAAPQQNHFRVLAPTIAVSGPGKTVMLLEVRGYEMLPDGNVDLAGVIAPPTPWHTVGHFKDTGVETSPAWSLAPPPLADIGGSLPTGNTGVFGIANVDGREYIQIRVTMYLKDSIGATDPGHALDLWSIRFSSDQ